MRTARERKGLRGARGGRGASPRPAAGEAQARVDVGALLNRLLFVMLAACIVALAVLSGRLVLERVGEQKIEYLKIEGRLVQVDEQEVSRALSAFRKQSMVAIDLDEVRRALEGHAWVRTVGIEREWPNTMIVHVTEQAAIARWGEGGLLNQDGEIFRPLSMEKQRGLPYLTGPEGSEREVMGQYQKFNQLLYPLGLRLSALDLNSRGAWRFELDNGLEVRVGSEQVMDRMRRFAAMVDSSLLETMEDVAAIDLRYPNGIAISRREAEDQDAVVALGR